MITQGYQVHPKASMATFRVRRAEADRPALASSEVVKTPPDWAFPPHVQSISSRARRSRGRASRRRAAGHARPRPEKRISLAAAVGSSCDGGRGGGHARVRWCRMEEAVLLAVVRRRRREEAEPPALLARVRRRQREEAALLSTPRRAAPRSEEALEGGDRAAHRPMSCRPRCLPE